jgi:uncharacterized protein
LEISKVNVKKTRSSPKSNKVVQKDFGNEFESANKRQREKQLSKLLENIKKKGRQIIETNSISAIHQYKNHIKEYLSIVLEDAYLVEKIHSMYNNTTTLVAIINKELDSLANSVLQQEKDTLAVISKIENIEGLLIDTFQ